MVKILGMGMIILALIFIAFGIFGIFRFENFFLRILISSKIDTVGYITLMLGVMLYKGITFFTLKVCLILVLAVVINPVTTHIIARSAYISGYRIGKD